MGLVVNQVWEGVPGRGSYLKEVPGTGGLDRRA